MSGSDIRLTLGANPAERAAGGCGNEENTQRKLEDQVNMKFCQFFLRRD